jgi:DNA-binding protein HU-beta
MNKNDLISAVADSSGLTKSDATKAAEAVFDAITGALKKGDEVRLVGFGTFSVAKRKASRQARSPSSRPARA